ncbi:hypothetical protein T492DRAFT_1041232 [Pavlovales sp. CCMP2436]|nr:hypothetical protein T492DRAFT_1041232 [Pavlovales sp. CCMP2436]
MLTRLLLYGPLCRIPFFSSALALGFPLKGALGQRLAPTGEHAPGAARHERLGLPARAALGTARHERTRFVGNFTTLPPG